MQLKQLNEAQAIAAKQAELTKTKINIEIASNQGEAKLAEALAINDRPVLINAEVIKSDNVFPMIPAGAPLAAMIITPPEEQLAKPTGST